MIETHSNAAAKDLSVGFRVARLRNCVGACLVCIAGIWASPALAQNSAGAALAPKLTNSMCLSCHGQEALIPSTPPGPSPVTTPSPIPKVLTDRFDGSVHGKLQCVECHTNITSIPHDKVIVQVSCVTCHESRLEDAKENNNTAEAATLSYVVQMIGSYMKSIHAQPSAADQSRTNATCYNCHDAHYVYPKGTPNYNWWRLNLPYTCGACHSSELAAYKTSVHGQEVLLDANPKAAVCSDCHSSHDIQSPFLTKTQLQITQNCGSCHQAQLASYMQTYHGQVDELGFTYTAKCFDCHGYHTIKRVTDPTSTVYPANRLQTCRQCHANATAGFVTFEPHANTHDFARYPYTWLASKFMLLLLGGTFAFFWTHSALWFYREWHDLEQRKHRPHVRVESLNGETGAPVVYYRRWPAILRIAHLSFAICTVMLVFTGMTLFNADTSWAPFISRLFGGPRVTGDVHRVFATGFLAIFFWQLGYVVYRIGRSWKTFNWFGPDSLVPSLTDIVDILAMFKWFFGLAPKPEFDRWTYWEKFDYWAPFWGVTIIGTTGAMMWAKYFTATYLPGWVFNVALIFHGEEAVLAAGFLFTVHFFNNHWRPEQFPLDIRIFTGVMPLEKFKEEHAIQYKRLRDSGELSKYLVDAPSRPMTLGSKILGFTLMACGLFLLTFVIYGLVERLSGG